MDEQQLQQLKHLTESLTPVPDIAMLMGMTEGELRLMIDDPSRPEFKAFHETLAQVALQIRERDLELADAGSPTAAAAVAAHLQKMLSSL